MVVVIMLPHHPYHYNWITNLYYDTTIIDLINGSY